MSQDDLTLALMLADRADTLTSARFGALDLRIVTGCKARPDRIHVWRCSTWIVERHLHDDLRVLDGSQR